MVRNILLSIMLLVCFTQHAACNFDLMIHDADLLQDDCDEIYPLDNLNRIFIMPEIHDDHVALEDCSDMQKDDERDESTIDMPNSIIALHDETMNHSGLCMVDDVDQMIVSDLHDEIVCVPHELINSVKKAQKKKQKLDKKNKRKFLQRFKKNEN